MAGQNGADQPWLVKKVEGVYGELARRKVQV